ncbi:MAG: adenylate/guanylate cyclase domain-containing protein [Rhizobacter sp.]|nr:adenylate/guanylate cyclase domain-containing protein [Ferruginibacter sp.]
MSKHFDYTALAQRFSTRFPVFSYVSIQVNFWVIANLLLGVILHLQALSISHAFNLSGPTSFTPFIMVAIILGVLYGIILGSTDYILDKRIFRKKPLGRIILLKTVISLSILILLFVLIRFILFDLLISSSPYGTVFTVTNKSWEYVFIILMIYYFFMTLVVNFINQVNKKYGPGVLLPLLLGKYRNPQEEERIFMFLDLKSSTSIAEVLGHLNYSSFIRDSFMDINQLLRQYNAAVYQYVGDEIVVTWVVNDGLKNFACIRFFFACEKQFLARKQYYIMQYGFLPHFKAGLHMGKVTAVEIGEIKRDIAYHGDTLNTAARMQSLCNEYKKKFLVSNYFFEISKMNEHFKTENMGMITLKGKKMSVGILSVEGFAD